jgi:hypothetical protein
MPKFNVYQVQEEVIVHKTLFVVEADTGDDAIEVVMNGEVEPTEQGTIGKPVYAGIGWSSRRADSPEESAWNEAVADMDERRLET